MPKLGLQAGTINNSYLKVVSNPLITWNFQKGTTTNSSGSATTSFVPTSNASIITGTIMTANNSSLGNSTDPNFTWNRTYSPDYATFSEVNVAGRYISFQTTVATGKTVVVTQFTGLFAEKNSSGPLQLALYLSPDNSNFTQIGSNVTPTTSVRVETGPIFSSNFSKSPLVLTAGTWYWRIYAWNNANPASTSARLGFHNNNLNDDDFSIIGYSI